jgi:hypothetical protein
MSEPELEDAISLSIAALKQYHWPVCASRESALEPVRALLALLDDQRDLGAVGKDAAVVAGAEFNRLILDAQGRRHNDSVAEANTCYRAGRALASILAKMEPTRVRTAREEVLADLASAWTLSAPAASDEGVA